MRKFKTFALSALLDDPEIRMMLSSDRVTNENFSELLFRLQDRLFEDATQSNGFENRPKTGRTGRMTRSQRWSAASAAGLPARVSLAERQEDGDEYLREEATYAIH
jgi:hypothetical protein